MAEVPAICENCLGDNPYLKMIKEPGGAQCRLCTRTFDLFKWANDNKKANKTIICLTCSRQRNCCQSCLMDLTYGIPINIRDAALKMAGVENEHEVEYSKNEVTKRLIAAKADQKYSEADSQGPKLIEGQKPADLKMNAERILTKLQISEAEKTRHLEKTLKNSKEPWAENSEKLKNVNVSKVVAKLPFNGGLSIPSDLNLTSFFIFGVTPEMTNIIVEDRILELLKHKKLRVKFRSVILNTRSRCGFVTFDKREVAEAFADVVQKPRGNNSPGLIFIKNTPVRVAWGKVRPLGKSGLEQAKIGLLVRKQMKLLAEKDKDEKLSKKPSENAKKGKNKKTDNSHLFKNKVQYETMSKDFEV